MADRPTEAQYLATAWGMALDGNPELTRYMGHIKQEMFDDTSFGEAYQVIVNRYSAGESLDDLEIAEELGDILGVNYEAIDYERKQGGTFIRNYAAKIYVGYRQKVQIQVLKEAIRKTEAGEPVAAARIANDLVDRLVVLHNESGNTGRAVTKEEMITEQLDKLTKTERGGIAVPYPKLSDQIGNLVPGDTMGVAAYSNGGKALALDTPIPTPLGWSTMGSLKVGDLVFDETGKPTKVVAATEVMYDHDCYEVVFSDGEVIVADADHQWFTDRPQRKSGISTTREIAETLMLATPVGRRFRHRIPVAGSLQLPELELPIHPYVLGSWIGDGNSANGGFTYGKGGEESITLMEGAGQSVRHRSKAGSVTLLGLQPKLREMGVLNNKHIPAVYLRASRDQRLALLQGLMDTDGCANADGSCEFTTTRKEIYDGALELLRSLGLKPASFIGRATLYGKDCGPNYRIKFSAFKDVLPVFGMKRKLDRQKSSGKHQARSQIRSIVAVNPVSSVPVRCIQVASKSHLYLAGKGMIPTHNSTFLANLFPHFVKAGTPCIVFPTEMREQWLARCISSHADVPQMFAERDQWSLATPEQRTAYEFAARDLQRCPWDIVNRPKIGPSEIIARATVLRRKYPGQTVVVMVDHMHRLDYGKDEADFVVGDATKRLRDWAADDREGGIILILLYQPRKPSDEMELYKPVDGYQIRGKSSVWNELDILLSPYRRWVKTVPGWEKNPLLRTEWGTPKTLFQSKNIQIPEFCKPNEADGKLDDEHVYLKIGKRRVGGEGPTVMFNINGPSGRIYELADRKKGLVAL